MFLSTDAAKQWNRHVFPDGLRVMKHHAKSRLVRLEEIQSVDVVLTTFHTVSSEWNEALPSLIFSVKWKRIILDEGELTLTGR